MSWTTKVWKTMVTDINFISKHIPYLTKIFRFRIKSESFAGFSVESDTFERIQMRFQTESNSLIDKILQLLFCSKWGIQKNLCK